MIKNNKVIRTLIGGYVLLKIEEIEYLGWEAYRLENKYLSIVILPKVGGRIISFSNKEDEILYTAPNLQGMTLDLLEVDNIKEYREKFKYIALGGYKTWLSPQSNWDWPPYLDLELGSYKCTYHHSEDKIKVNLISPICRESKMQLTRTIVLERDSYSLKIGQGMKNCSLENKECGLWDVTQIADNGQVILPISSFKKIKNLIDTDGTEGIKVLEVNEELYAIINCFGDKMFKIGTDFSAGWVLAIIDKGDKRLGYLKRFPIFEGANFGHGCAVEIFDISNYNYFEIEVHGPLSELLPEEEYGFVEEWELYSWDNQMTIKDIIKKLVY